jgi:hypothetical protein
MERGVKIPALLAVIVGIFALGTVQLEGVWAETLLRPFSFERSVTPQSADRIAVRGAEGLWHSPLGAPAQFDVQPSVRILVRNADSLWQSSLDRPDFTSGPEAAPTPVSPTPTSEPPTATLTLVGDASQTGSYLRLTENQYFQSSAAWFADKQSVADEFTVSFDWRFSRDNPRASSDGIAFVIQNASGITLGDSGHGIGYGGIANSLAVEFDTYRNVASEFEGQLDDPNDNHLSVQSRGGWWQNNPDPAYSLGSATAIPFLSDGE